MKGSVRRSIFVLCGIVSLVAVFFAARIFINAFLMAELTKGDRSSAAMGVVNVPVTVSVFGRSSDTISARISFYSGGGDLLGSFERSWSGWELKIDCVLVRTGERWLAFPFSLSTDETGRGAGVDLIRYYDISGFPAIYESRQLDKAERTALTRLFSVVKTERWMPRFLGTLRHETVLIRSFEAGTEYSLFVDEEGNLLVR